MIIDTHAHLVTPPELLAHRANLLASGGFSRGKARVPEESVRKCADHNVALLDEVGTDLQLLSPRPFQMGQSMKPSHLVEPWIASHNDVIAKTIELHPTRFAGVAALPIIPDAPVSAAFAELERAVKELGFVGAMVNPDAHEGTGNSPALDDEYWYPLYEKLIELEVPMQIHSSSCYSGRETYSEHFITEESIAILAMIRGKVFEKYPDLRVIISHGGGSVPYQLGRWQAERFHPGLKGGEGSARFEDELKKFYFDSVLHYPLALELLIRTVGSDRVLFGTERPGSGSARNPDTGHDYDDLKRVIDSFDHVTDDDRRKIYIENSLGAFPRLRDHAALKGAQL